MPRELASPTVTLSPSRGIDGELIGKYVGLDRGLHGAVGELSGHTDRLEEKPALQEPVGVRRFGADVGRASDGAGPRAGAAAVRACRSSDQ